MSISIVASLLISFCYSLLFFEQSLGVSMLLFMLITCITLIYVLKQKQKLLNSKGLILMIPITLLSSTYLFFDSPLLKNLNIIVILILMALMFMILINKNFKNSYIVSKIWNIILGPLDYVKISLQDLFKSVKPNFKDEDERKDVSNQKKRILFGILKFSPIIIIVLLLLVSADDTFANMFSGISKLLNNLFSSNTIARVISIILLFVAVFIYTLAFIYNIVNDENYTKTVDSNREKTKRKFDTVSINVGLTILNIIYFIFTFVQINNVFNNQIVSYSSNARQGFFQLMLVSLINFVLIIISAINEAQETEFINKYKKFMNICTIAFTGALIIIAFQKMYLYETLLGFTYLRLLVYWALATEFILIVPTIIYVYNSKFNLLQSYFIIILCMYIGLNFVNIDKLIAKRNVDRYISTGKIDFYYLEYIDSADITLEIIRLKDFLDSKTIKNEELYTDVDHYLYWQKFYMEEEQLSWQSYNIPKYNSRKQLEKINTDFGGYDYENNGW